MSHNSAQPMLPNFSRLRLARTGMTADDAMDDDDEAPCPGRDPPPGGNAAPPCDYPAAPLDPAPGEVATLHDQYLETSDFFRAVLEQVKNVEDLKDACEIAKTWCALDSGRKAACGDSDDTWKELARTLFTQYVPDPSEGVTWERHFYSLCNMDPIDRLERTAKGREAVLRVEIRARLEAQAAADDSDDDNASMPDLAALLDQQVVAALFRDGGAVGSERTMAPNDAWTTERDDRADVTIALTRICSAMAHMDYPLVQAFVMGAIIDLMTSIGADYSIRPSMRQREQAARLTTWLFRTRPDVEVVRPLGNISMGRASWMDHLSDILYTTIQWGLFSVPRASAEALYENSDRVTLSLEALKDIAVYKDGDAFDWSEYATPRVRSGRTSCHFSAAALRYYLDHGNYQQKDRICLLIAHSLHLPANEVSSGVKPWDRKLEFAKELARTRAMDRLGTVGIGDLPLSRASVAALGSIAGQLSAHAWGRSWN